MPIAGDPHDIQRVKTMNLQFENLKYGSQCCLKGAGMPKIVPCYYTNFLSYQEPKNDNRRSARDGKSLYICVRRIVVARGYIHIPRIHPWCG